MCREANLASSSSWMYIAYNIYWSLFNFHLVSRCFIDIFLIDIMFVVTPYWPCFYFRQKGGEHFFIIGLIDKKREKDFYPSFYLLFWLFTPLLMNDKKGEKDFEFDICIVMFLHILSLILSLIGNWYLEHLVFLLMFY